MTNLPKTIRENLHFLCAEIDGQLLQLEAFFKEPTIARARRILERAGYAHNLKARIHAACVRQLANTRKDNRKHLTLRSLELVATDLQRIANLARQSLRHVERIDTFATLLPERYPAIVRSVRKGVGKIENAFFDNDSKQAIEIGELQKKIETDYRKLFKAYTRDMGNPNLRPADIANSLLVANEFQRMGDSLNTISEALISANIGQAVNLERYFALQSLKSDLEGAGGGLKIETIAETRSGSSVSALKNKKTEEVAAVFKDGEKSKVREERAGVKSWHEIYPGLAPKILSYEKRDQSAALLIEHLPGTTFEHIVLNGSEEICKKALASLSTTLKDVWKQTKTPEPAELGSMQQLTERLDEVRRIHPEFKDPATRFAGQKLPCLDGLVAEANAREMKVSAPFPSIFMATSMSTTSFTIRMKTGSTSSTCTAPATWTMSRTSRSSWYRTIGFRCATGTRDIGSCGFAWTFINPSRPSPASMATIHSSFASRLDLHDPLPAPPGSYSTSNSQGACG